MVVTKTWDTVLVGSIIFHTPALYCMLNDKEV